MAANSFQFSCGHFATIDMAAWVHGVHIIACSCGRKLDARDSLFGFGLNTAKYAWRDYMIKELVSSDS